MNQINEWLSGKKTYIVALAGILAAIAAYASGELDLAQTIQAVLASLGLSTLRAGVSKGVK